MTRTFLSIRTILLLTISTLTLLIASLAMREVYLEWQRLNKIHALTEATLLGDRLFDAAEKLSVERDIAFSMLHAADANMIQDLRQTLEDSRQEVDSILQTTLLRLKDYNFPGVSTLSIKSNTQYNTINALRKAVDEATKLPLDKRDPALSKRWFEEDTKLILQTQELWTNVITHFTDVDSAVALHMQLKYLLGVIMDYAGRERALIGRLIVENVSPTPEEQAQLLRWQGMIELGWGRIENFSEQSGLNKTLTPYLKDARSHYVTLYDMVRDIFYMPGAKHEKTYPISIDLWLALSTQTTDSLYAIKDAALKETHRYVETLETKARDAILMHVFILVSALSLCAYSFRIVSYRVIHPINLMIQALLDATQGKPITFITPQPGRRDEIGKLAQVLHVFQRNMEEIKHTSLAIERYARDLERSNKELDDFAYIASHDLKEPLRGIHNHSRFLIEDNEKILDEESNKRLNRLIYLSQRLEKLVNDLLYFSRLGRQELAIQPTAIEHVILDVENTLDVMLEQRNARITVHQPLPTITCDAVRVTEVFRNLIVNAIKYNNKEEKHIEVGFLETHQDKKHVFFVKDNGEGIAPEFFEEVFRIFKRLHSSKNAEEEGTGAGLTFVKKIVERHGGTIWLESEINQGTTFYFTLEDQPYDPNH